MPWRTRCEENGPPLHTFIRWSGAARKKTKKHSNEYTLKCAHIQRESRLFISFTPSRPMLSLGSLTAFFSKDNHHHSSNALEQLLGLCSVVSQSTTNNVWLVEKVEWNSATAFKNKRATHTHTRIHRWETCVRATMRGFSIYILGCIQRRSYTHTYTVAESKRC